MQLLYYFFGALQMNARNLNTLLLSQQNASTPLNDIRLAATAI